MRWPISGAPVLSGKDQVELNRRIAAWRLSVLVYGEQGAMLACSQMVNIVQGTDATLLFDAAMLVALWLLLVLIPLWGLAYATARWRAPAGLWRPRSRQKRPAQR